MRTWCSRCVQRTAHWYVGRFQLQKLLLDSETSAAALCPAHASILLQVACMRHFHSLAKLRSSHSCVLYILMHLLITLCHPRGHLSSSCKSLRVQVYTFLQDVQAMYNPEFIIKTDDDVYIRQAVHVQKTRLPLTISSLLYINSLLDA